MNPSPPPTASLLAQARAFLGAEAAALRATADALDERFAEALAAVEAAHRAGRKLLFAGVGKNAPIGDKLARTFSSTGVPAVFLDPGHALHGDLGMCAAGDLAFILSNSGQTPEALRLVPPLRALGVRTAALTARPDSDLARQCDLALPYAVPAEACPLGLAPTASTTAALALGDALAMTYVAVRGFSRDDFARYHPAGSLGASLLLRVREVMRTGERCALRPADVTVQEAILAITKAKSGIVVLTDPATGALAGVFSDGDFRRLMLRAPDGLAHPVRRYMTPAPKTVPADALAAEAVRRFAAHNINDLVVVDAAGLPVGVLDTQDLPRLRLV